MYPATNTSVKQFLQEEKSTTFKQALCENLRNFCRQTATHGFVHIVDHNEMWYLRIAWAIIITVLAGIVIKMVHLSTVNLFNGGLTTEIFLRSVHQNRQAIILPDIHICDTSIFSATRLKDMGLNDKMGSYLSLALAEYATHQEFYDNPNLLDSLKEDFDNILFNRSLNMTYILRTATIKCHEIVWACSLDYVQYNVTHCCERFFESHTTVSIFGSCISTHSRGLYQRYDTRNAGFTVYVQPNLRDKIVFDPHLVKLEYILQRGIYYAVSSPAVPVYYALHTDGRFAQPRTWALVPISKTVIDNSELKDNPLAPYTCVDSQDADFKAERTPGYDQYSGANCHTATWQKKYVQNVSCSAAFYDDGKAINLCDPYTIITIVTEAGESLDAIPDEYCPIACVTELYDISSSYAEFNSNYLGYLNEKFSEPTDSISDPIALNFFYQSYNYQVYVNHVNSLLKFLGEIGGSLGLFLGASIISILEIAALLIRCLFVHK